ncbi:MAG: diguanylate cyclase response regulator [Candidatus Poribacteria bacterium]|nr:MAG: diguanylate cyclase response regulator [Candidatus Poribacteria bacterium]
MMQVPWSVEKENLAGALILVVDDDHHNLFMLQRRLESHNYRVITASSGRTVVELAEEHRPDLILLDVSLPDMDGFEVKEALNQNESTMNIPVIFHSNRVQIEYKIRAFELGADDFITKPFHPEELLARVEVALRHYFRERRLVEEILRLEEQMRTGGVEAASEEEALDKLDRAIQTAEAQKRPLSVLAVKINGLEALSNQSLARVILMETTDVLNEMISASTDTILSYKEQGQYLIYAIGMPIKRAQILAEGLKSSIMVRAFTDPEAERTLTVSIGIAGREAGSGIGKEELLQGAIEAMEQASAAGGNRTVVKRFE